MESCECIVINVFFLGDNYILSLILMHYCYKNIYFPDHDGLNLSECFTIRCIGVNKYKSRVINIYFILESNRFEFKFSQ